MKVGEVEAEVKVNPRSSDEVVQDCHPSPRILRDLAPGEGEYHKTALRSRLCAANWGTKPTSSANRVNSI